MNKMREYERGREDGLTLALRIVKQGGNRSPGAGSKVPGDYWNTYLTGRQGPGQGKPENKRNDFGHFYDPEYCCFA